MKVLVVVDMQNDFVSGALGTPEAQSIVPNVVKKIEEYANYGEDVRIYFTKDSHFFDYLDTEEGKNLPISHCLVNTEGWEFVSEIKDWPDNVHNFQIVKNTFGSIKLSTLLREDKYEIESVELVGLCTDICVISNAIIAKTGAYDSPIYVDASCCAGTTPEAHDKAIDLMKNSLQIHILNEGKEPWRK